MGRHSSSGVPSLVVILEILMHSTRNVVLAVGVLTAAVCAQSFTTALPGTFIDISTMGGTVVTGVGDDTEHNILTTIGNVLFPAGNVRIGNNGVAVAGITTGDVSFINQPIPATSVPGGLPAGGAGYLCPFWDDLLPTAGSAQTIWFRESRGVLTILWKNESHFDFPNAAQTITFEIQVRASAGPCEPLIQFLYSDTEFGGTGTSNDNGAGATIGFLSGSNAAASNIHWGFETASVPSGTVLSILAPSTLAASSPFGPGSLQLNLGTGPCSGTYILAVTLNEGAFPNGWLFGLDIPFSELANEIAIGFPFVGPLDSTGGLVLGPFGGLPPITIYAIGLGFMGGVLSSHTPPLSYTIP